MLINCTDFGMGYVPGIRIFLNGEEVQYALWADTDSGEVCVCGGFIRNSGIPHTAIIRGLVTFECSQATLAYLKAYNTSESGLNANERLSAIRRMEG